jgi:hypothetical protein
MNTHADKTQKNKSYSVANAFTQKQSGGKSTFQFVDNRPETIAQRKLQEMANNSRQSMQLKSFQKKANNIVTPNTSNEVVQMQKYYRWTSGKANVVECSKNAYKKSRLKASENDYFKHNKAMKQEMNPIISRTYETVADGHANTGKPVGGRQRSQSVHVPTRNRSGSVDIRHTHDNINSVVAPRNVSVGHIDRHGVRSGRLADATSRTGAAPITKPEGRNELNQEEIQEIDG